MGQTLPGGHPVWISPSVPVQSSPMKTVPSWMLVQRWWQEFWWWVGLQGKPWLSSKNGWILLAHAFCLCLFSCSTFSVVVMPRMEQPSCDHEDRTMEQESLKQKSWNSDIWILCFVKQQTPHLVKLSFMSLFYVWVSCPKWGECNFAPRQSFAQCLRFIVAQVEFIIFISNSPHPYLCLFPVLVCGQLGRHSIFSYAPFPVFNSLHLHEVVPF